MGKSLLQHHYHQLLSTYNKLNKRFKQNLVSGRFIQFTRAKQIRLMERLERLKAKLQRLETKLKVAGSLVALGIVLGTSEAEAQISPAGAEFRVNTYTTSAQENASVAMDSDGDFVVTWSSDDQDGSSYGIYGQRFNASGIAQGSEFRVNTYTASVQSSSAIAMDSDGDFVITWMSNLQDGSTFGIYGQRFNASGIAQGSEFRVNTITVGQQRNPAIAMDLDGDFVIAWQSQGDGSGYGVYAQRYNASGVAQGSEFRVNTYTTNGQFYPSIAMDSDGDFVIAWSSQGQDGSLNGVYAQRFNASGEAQGLEFRVNGYTTNSQEFPSIAMDSDGDFVIAWSSRDQDGSGVGIYAQRYNASGAALDFEFRVNTYTAIDQKNSSISMDSDGDFVVTWEGYEELYNYGIYGRRYNASGAAQGAEFKINTFSIGYQITPAIAMDSDGDFVVTWASGEQDGSRYSVHAQRYSVAKAPTDIALSATTINENVAANSTIGTLSTTDQDAGDTFTYSLVSGTGDADNASFTISGSDLRIAGSPDFETKSSYSIRIRTTDQGGLNFEKVFTITISNLNEAPTDIALSATTINENVAANSTIGALSTTDQDAGDTFTYSLVSGTGDADNASFTISGSDLRIVDSPDFETKSSYSIRIRTTDNGGLNFEKVFTIGINDLVETSVLTGMDNATLVLYPNPAQDQVMVNIEGVVNVRVLDLSGRLIKEVTLANKQLNVADLNSGSYLIELTKDGQTITKMLKID
ncbi:MAG: T9SS type A sorting domain-containing protein [Cytophagaceae bacterium]|nr:T9SS type A sorting domain-containing protein [Cytophagaceae bacterium]